MNIPTLALLITLAIAVAGCGQKSALYLDDHALAEQMRF
jgi:predicted small lipoprotein YifL